LHAYCTDVERETGLSSAVVVGKKKNP